MALKRIFDVETTLEILIEEEAWAHSPELENERSWYVSVAKAFGLPPKGCPKNRYLLARSYAADIFKYWLKMEPKLSKTDTTLGAVLKAAIIFELANYLVSLNLEEAPIINRNPGKKWKHDYFLRTPQKRDEILAEAKEQIKAVEILLESSFLPSRLGKGLIAYLNMLKCRRDLAKDYTVFIFRGDGFRVEKHGEKTRIHEYVRDSLAFNLVEVIHRIFSQENKVFTLKESRSIVMTFINAFIDPKATSSKGELNEDSFNQRYKEYRRKYGGLKMFESAFFSSVNRIIDSTM